jgi:hypothetical protein
MPRHGGKGWSSKSNIRYSHNADYAASHNIAVRYVEQRCESVTTRTESAPRGRAKKAAALQPAE